MASKQVAITIIEQLGGLGKLRAMVSASNFLSSDDSLQFSFKGYRKANKCVITLMPNDLYKMQLGKLNMKKCEWVESYNEEGLYWEMLKPIFEQETGLYLSL